MARHPQSGKFETDNENLFGQRQWRNQDHSMLQSVGPKAPVDVGFSDAQQESRDATAKLQAAAQAAINKGVSQ